MIQGCTRDTLRCEYWAQGERYVRPECCTQHLKDLLFFTHQLLERHAIKHWLDFGALLGAVRNGEFIPWDSDVDFGILCTDVGRLTTLGDEVARAGHWLDMRDPLVVRIQLSAANTQHVDLFPWREEEGLLKIRWPGYSSESWAFPQRYLDRATRVELYGGQFPAPAPVDEFLVRYRYGDDYLVPLRPEEIALRDEIASRVRAFVAGRERHDSPAAAGATPPQDERAS